MFKRVATPAGWLRRSCHAALIASPFVVAGCLPIARLNRNEPFRAADLKLSAANVDAVHVRVQAGQVTFQSATNDSIAIVADLVSHDADRLADVCRPSTRLVQEMTGRTLHVRLEQSNRDQCGERWVLQLPARLAARADVFVGDVRLDVRLRAVTVQLRGPGSVKGSVGSSAVDVDVTTIGDIDLTVMADDVGAAKVESELGRVSLSVNGLNVAAVSRPGRGGVAEVSGRGSGRMSARTRNGSASVRLSPSRAP